MFTDLVGFIERQVKIASDPVFGNIQVPQLTNSKTFTASHFKQRKKGSRFATDVTAVKEGVITCSVHKVIIHWINAHSYSESTQGQD